MAIQKHPTGQRWEEIVKCTDERRQSQLISNYIADLQAEIRVQREEISDYSQKVAELEKNLKALKKATKDKGKLMIVQMKPKDLVQAMKEYGDYRADKAKTAAEKSASQYLQEYIFNGGC